MQVSAWPSGHACLATSKQGSPELASFKQVDPGALYLAGQCGMLRYARYRPGMSPASAAVLQQQQQGRRQGPQRYRGWHGVAGKWATSKQKAASTPTKAVLRMLGESDSLDTIGAHFGGAQGPEGGRTGAPMPHLISEFSPPIAAASQTQP